MTSDEYAKQRRTMVATQLVERGIRDQAVLQAMRTVPREVFVEPALAGLAYHDGPLPIGDAQTISQPYIVALMTEALMLSPDDCILEIGTGSGYAAAVLSCLVKEVYTVERLASLVKPARRRLRELGYSNVQVLYGNGTLGCPEHAPYDGIVVTAGSPGVPEALRAQMAIGGRLVIPVGEHPQLQNLIRVTRKSDAEWCEEDLGGVCFVPLIGVEGWGDEGVDLNGWHIRSESVMSE